MSTAAVVWIIWTVFTGIMLVVVIANLFRLWRANAFAGGNRLFSGVVGLMTLAAFIVEAVLASFSGNSVNEALFAFVFGFLGSAFLIFIVGIYAFSVHQILRKA